MALQPHDLEPFSALYGRVEIDMSSYGWLDGRLVALDFGGAQWP
jgi:hypothetical protein